MFCYLQHLSLPPSFGKMRCSRGFISSMAEKRIFCVSFSTSPPLTFSSSRKFQKFGAKEQRLRTAEVFAEGARTNGLGLLRWPEEKIKPALANRKAPAAQLASG